MEIRRKDLEVGIHSGTPKHGQTDRSSAGKERFELIMKGAVSCPCASGLGDGGEGDEQEWYMLNDFLVERTVVEDALGFLPDWKEPCILLYRDRQAAGEQIQTDGPCYRDGTGMGALVLPWNSL
jgi:hypothetical protein